MAHIITDFGSSNVFKHNGKQIYLNCMCSLNKTAKNFSNNSEQISKNIEQATKAKQQLDADIFEREQKIIQSAKSKKELK